jgi:uncharacterized protein (TIGR01777 family)
MSERIIVTGSTGFIGKILVNFLVENGYTVVALTRNPQKAQELFSNEIIVESWDAKTSSGWLKYIDGSLAIINLAGENIAGGLWTKKRLDKIIQSRLNSINAIIDAIKNTRNNPQIVLQASAIGIYGSRGDKKLDENSSIGLGILAHLTQIWEQQSQEIEKFGILLKRIRIGLVLGRSGGILSRLEWPFKFYLGGHFGSGKQWFSWVHIDDVLNSILFLLKESRPNGVYNLTAPKAVRAKEFYRVFGDAINRPSWLQIPETFLRLGMGKMGRELLLASQRVYPKNLLDDGFSFQFPELRLALKHIVSK